MKNPSLIKLVRKLPSEIALKRNFFLTSRKIFDRNAGKKDFLKFRRPFRFNLTSGRKKKIPGSSRARDRARGFLQQLLLATLSRAAFERRLLPRVRYNVRATWSKSSVAISRLEKKKNNNNLLSVRISSEM